MRYSLVISLRNTCHKMCLNVASPALGKAGATAEERNSLFL